VGLWWNPNDFFLYIFMGKCLTLGLSGFQIFQTLPQDWKSNILPLGWHSPQDSARVKGPVVPRCVFSIVIPRSEKIKTLRCHQTWLAEKSPINDDNWCFKRKIINGKLSIAMFHYQRVPGHLMNRCGESPFKQIIFPANETSIFP
jgi:hypothetical protein